jgi:hypothetical protein
MLMPIVRACLLATLGCCIAFCQGTQSISWPDILSWFVAWDTRGSKGDDPFRCEGQVRSDGAVQFRCSETVLVVDVGFDSTDGCFIQFMRKAFSYEVGQFAAHRRPDLTVLQNCMPLSKDGKFIVSVPTWSSKGSDSRLTEKARKNALAYSARAGLQSCNLRIPKLHFGDPFFHVYRKCGGVIDAVWEFTVRFGELAEFPHWMYTAQRGTLPEGYAQRLEDSMFWDPKGWTTE